MSLKLDLSEQQIINIINDCSKVLEINQKNINEKYDPLFDYKSKIQELIDRMYKKLDINIIKKVLYPYYDINKKYSEDPVTVAKDYSEKIRDLLITLGNSSEIDNYILTKPNSYIPKEYTKSNEMMLHYIHKYFGEIIDKIKLEIDKKYCLYGDTSNELYYLNSSKLLGILYYPHTSYSIICTDYKLSEIDKNSIDKYVNKMKKNISLEGKLLLSFKLIKDNGKLVFYFMVLEDINSILDKLQNSPKIRENILNDILEELILNIEHSKSIEMKTMYGEGIVIKGDYLNNIDKKMLQIQTEYDHKTKIYIKFNPILKIKKIKRDRVYKYIIVPTIYEDIIL